MQGKRRHRILLVQSYLGDKELPVLPLGLALLAGALPDHDVKILDMNIEHRPFDALEMTLRKFAPNIVGISVRNIDSTNKREITFYYKYLRPTLKKIRSIGSKPVLVLGGAGFSMYAERIMKDADEGDYGVYLEGEETFPELLDNLDNPKKVKGLFYNESGNLIFTGERQLLDFTQISCPRWDLLDMNSYSSNSTGIGIETKRGCALKCAYCPYPFLNGERYRLKPPESVVNEIEELIHVHKVNEVTFIDSVFNIPLSHATEICKGMIDRKLNLNWTAWFNEQNITKDFLLLARRAGCINFIFSPDGLSDSVLKSINKNINRKDILKVFQLIKEIGDIRVSYNFFKNPPGQTLKGALSMLAFFFKAKRELGGKRVSFELNSLRIEPHTTLCNIANKEGIIEEGEDLLFPKYYSNPKTRYIETLFNLMLKLKGK